PLFQRSCKAEWIRDSPLRFFGVLCRSCLALHPTKCAGTCHHLFALYASSGTEASLRGMSSSRSERPSRTDRPEYMGFPDRLSPEQRVPGHQLRRASRTYPGNHAGRRLELFSLCESPHFQCGVPHRTNEFFASMIKTLNFTRLTFVHGVRREQRQGHR